MLQPGTRVGPYEVVAPLGAGGMGEVYRARDTVLGREVALKTLPDDVARQPQRLARLRREARILASLNHPGIATLHGLEEKDGTPVIVMEVVEGETLSDRLRRGPLPVKDSLRIGQQVAEAVAAAHQRGVLHRDLKPANVRTTRDGRAKVLDFGLARAEDEREPPLDSGNPTLTSPVSRPGVVAGTAPYMSPEQARGQEVDARTDVWAFGCLLFEMLTGRRAFPGATFSEVSASILERDPDFAALPESTPFVLQRLLRRCLRRDKEERLRDLADAALELRELRQEISSGSPVATLGTSGARAVVRPHGRRRLIVVVAGLFLLAAGGLGLWAVRRPPARPGDARQPRFEATLPRGVALLDVGNAVNPVALSPDGQRLAFVGCGDTGCQIYLRDRREIDARPLAGTEGARSPFFSPDGRWVAFGARGKLKKAALDGSAVVVLADAPQFRGGSWGDDGAILFNRGRSGLFRVAAEGGEVQEVTKPDPARRDYDHRWPQHLPGGRAALLDVTLAETYDHSVAVLDLATGRTRILVENAGSPRWSPTGHLLFGRHGLLYAAPFDARTLAISGPPVKVLEGVAMWNSPGGGSAGGNVYYALAPDGTLVYSPREARLPKRRLVWLDRQGRPAPVTPREQCYTYAFLSPDGRRVAANVELGPGVQGAPLVLDVSREAWTKVVVEGEEGLDQVFIAGWMPDGRHLLVVTTARHELRLLRVSADGAGVAEVLRVGDAAHVSPAPDGRSILFCQMSAPAQWDIWRLVLDGSREAQPFLVTPVLEVSPSFSPDGRFVAYRSHESGQSEVYVRPSAGPGARHLVSTDGGTVPLWSRDGREIFFVASAGAVASSGRRALMSAATRTTSTFASEPPRKLFDLPDEILYGFGFYDVTPDGQRFLMIERDPFELRPLGLVIVPNWTTELAARMAAVGSVPEP